MPDIMNKPRVVIFSQGDEVITGALVDTNAAYLAEQCRLLGFDIVRHVTVADDMAELIQVLKEVDAMADICLCTGGLGPTQDDLTTEAFAEAFQKTLEMDLEALEMMREFFAKLKAPMADVNKKQALLPTGSVRIDNRWGTAPGFTAVGQQCRFYFMPGVPFEMQQMMETFVIADLQRQFNVDQPQLITFRSMGMGESSIQQAVDELDIASDIRISFRAGMPENELKLLFPKHYSHQHIQAYIDDIKGALLGSVFAVDGFGQSVKSLPDCVDQLMAKNNLTLALIESLSQGDIARQCHPAWLRQAEVYPKVDDLMVKFGAEGKEVGEGLAVDLVKAHQAQHATNCSLIQLYERKADSTVAVYTAVANHQSELSSTKEVWGRPLRQQTVASALAFNLLRQLIQDL